MRGIIQTENIKMKHPDFRKITKVLDNAGSVPTQ